MRKKIFTFLLAIVASIGMMFAEIIEHVQIDDLYYNLDTENKTASVTYQDGTWESNYSGLTVVNIPPTVNYNADTYDVTSIGNWAFFVNNSITTITIPNSVKNIEKRAFSACESLSSINIPESVTSIEEEILCDCPNIVSIEIPNSITSIGNRSFQRSALSSIEIPNSVTSIGDGAFSYCSNLTSVIFPNSVTFVGEAPFWQSDKLTSPIYNEHVFAYLPKSYYGALNIPDGITVIAGGVFGGCDKLTSVTIPEGVTKIDDGTFSKCTNLTSVELPTTLTTIGESVFYKCSQLKSLVFPDKVKKIGERICEECYAIEYLVLGKSVSEIGNYAFDDCTKIKEVHSLNRVAPTIARYTFYSLSQKTIFYVPFGSSRYNSSWWKDLNIQVDAKQSLDISPTRCVITFNMEDDPIVSCAIENGEVIEGNQVELAGLEPFTQYKQEMTLTSSMWVTGEVQIPFTTTALTLTTKESKPVSSTTAILLAETNMSEAEVNCGFEYKRNDAPDAMAGTKVYCPVSNGTMAGRLKNLKDDVYYKYRAFYQSAAGNMYYGDWQYIFTGDVTVEFDPVIYTYEATSVKENEATLKGYAIAGAEDFTEQGFEYWADSRLPQDNNAPARMRAALGEHRTVQATGIKMQVTLTDLDAGTVYKYRTYAKVGDQVCYGTEMTFTTKGVYDEEQGLDQITNDQLPISHKILHNGQIYILRGDKVYNVTGMQVK